MRYASRAAVVAALLLVGGCGDAQETATSTSTSAPSKSLPTPSATPMAVDAYVLAAGRICSDGQQKVYTAVNEVLMGEAFPQTFPSDSFVKFYRQTHAIGVETVDQLSDLQVPAGQEPRRDADLAFIQRSVDFTVAAGKAVAGSDGSAYQRLVAEELAARPADPLLPEDCLALSLGPGAGR